MTWKEIKELILSDLFRYSGMISITCFFKQLYNEPGFKYSFWMRICAWLRHGVFIKHLFSIQQNYFFVIMKRNSAFRFLMLLKLGVDFTLVILVVLSSMMKL